MNYSTDCPNCGRELELRIGSHDRAPFVCMGPQGCSRSWWRTELNHHGRRLWEPLNQSHNHDLEFISKREVEITQGRRLNSNVRLSEVARLEQSEIDLICQRLDIPGGQQEEAVGLLRQMETGEIQIVDLARALTDLELAHVADHIIAEIAPLQ